MSAGASVTVVAPTATPAIAELADEGKLQWHGASFEPGDLEGMTLVVAAVPKDVATRSLRGGADRGVLCNSVDDTENCDFYYPAVVNRGDLQIAISTGGHSPALAQRLRIELEQQFGPEYAEWIQQLGTARRELFADRHGSRGARSRSCTSSQRTGSRIATAAGHVYLDRRGSGRSGTADVEGAPHPRAGGRRSSRRSADAGNSRAHSAHGARVECVGKRHGERQITQQEINRRLCDYGAAGQKVVRLKGGRRRDLRPRERRDGRAARGRHVPFSIVPGVTAASGAAAAAGVSLTDRRLGSALVFLTAQRCKGNPPPNWKAVAELGGTTAIYMPGGHEAELARQLMEAGMPPETPCFVVASASRPDEQVVETTLGEMPRFSSFRRPPCC